MSHLIKILRKKFLQHLMFWLLSIYVIGSYFSIVWLFEFIDFFYALLFHIPLTFLVYINLRVLLPKFLNKRKYLLYFLYIPILLFTSYLVHELTFDYFFPLLDSAFYIVSFTDWLVVITIFIIYLVLTTLIKLSKSWYVLQQVEKEKLNIELNSLKTQINPHFLFNSLNSIYSQALVKSDETAHTVLELSDLLRYMLYEVGEDQVELAKEVEMLENYIELQKLRVENAHHINFKVSGELDGVKIAPLLVFPLVENAFKHGLKGDSDNAYVDIQLTINGGIEFEIKNNIGQVDDMEKGKYGGIGLENVRRRLELIYPDRHQLYIQRTNNEFHVKLTLQ